MAWHILQVYRYAKTYYGQGPMPLSTRDTATKMHANLQRVIDQHAHLEALREKYSYSCHGNDSSVEQEIMEQLAVVQESYVSFIRTIQADAR